MITTELISRHKDKRELPDGWRWMNLGDVCEIVAPQVDPKIPKYGSLPHVSGENIEGGACRLTHLKTAAEDGMTSGKYLFDPGDVLYSKLRPYLRKAVVVDFQGLCSADMYPIKVNQDFLDPHFTAWMLVSEEFTTYADAESRRARMPKLNRDELFAWNAPLPPLDEQKRIAAILNEQMEAVKRSRQATLAQLEAAKALPAAYFRAVFYSPEAREWKWVKFGESPLEIIDGDRGENYPKQSDFSNSGYCLFLNTGNVTTSGFNFSSCTFINQKLDAVLRTGRLQVNDVVLTTRGTVGNTAWFSETVPYSAIRINSGMVILRTNTEHLLPNFLCLFIRSPKFREQVLSLQSGTAQPQLPIRDLKRIELPLPPLPEQKRIAATLTEQMADVQQLCQSLQEQFDTINKLPASLLRRAFNGEL